MQKKKSAIPKMLQIHIYHKHIPWFIYIFLVQCNKYTSHKNIFESNYKHKCSKVLWNIKYLQFKPLIKTDPNMCSRSVDQRCISYVIVYKLLHHILLQFPWWSEGLHIRLTSGGVIWNVFMLSPQILFLSQMYQPHFNDIYFAYFTFLELFSYCYV